MWKYYDVIVTGNGYDLSLDLPTKYEDFYTLLNKISNKEEIKCEHINKETLFKFEQIVLAAKDNNFFIKYILRLKKIFDRWCDFESELKTILETFDYITFSNFDIIHSGPNYFFFNLENMPNTNIFNEKIIGTWRDLEFKNYDFSKGRIKILNNTMGDYFVSKENESLIKEKIIKYLDDDLDEFKNIFCKYLELFVNPLPVKDKPAASANYVFTFNYTHFSSYFCKNNLDIVYFIHGEADKNEIVLGVDDVIDFKNHKLTNFTKITQRSLLSKQIDMSILNENSIGNIAYIGLSFNESDKSGLIDFLSVRNATHNIYYYDKKSQMDIVTNLQNIIGYQNYSTLYKAKKIIFHCISELYED